MTALPMTYSAGRELFASDEIVGLPAGRRQFSLVFDDLSAVEGHECWNVDIVLRWAGHFEGSTANYSVLLNGVSEASGVLNAFGDTLLSFSTRWDALPVVLEFAVDVVELTPNLPLNAADAFEAPLEARRIVLNKATNIFASRLPLMRLALAAALQMGLDDMYMDDARTDALRREVIGALHKKRGYSLIRLGDGEGRVIGYPGLLSQNELLLQVLNYQFGPQSMELCRELHGRGWVDICIQELKRLLLDSLSAADRVAFPVADFFSASEAEWGYGQIGYAGAMMYLPTYHSKAGSLEPIGTNLFQQLARRNDFFGPVAKAATRLFTVGPWDMTEELSAALGVESLTHIQVQRHYTWSDEKGWGQFPHLYKVTMQTIRALGDVRGCLFFVGAGLLGKAYCAAIKRQGGVALDIGSVFDTWAKKGLPYAVENAEQFSLSSLSDGTRQA
jgi:hypothetical protein